MDNFAIVGRVKTGVEPESIEISKINEILSQRNQEDFTAKDPQYYRKYLVNSSEFGSSHTTFMDTD